MSPASSRGTSKLPRDQREALLLDAAREEFGVSGYGGASLGLIAARAGVSKALVVTYFGSKDGLYAACAQRAGDNLVPRIEDAISQPLPPGPMALATLTAIFAGLEGRQRDWSVLMDRTVPLGGEAASAAQRQRRLIAEQASRGVGSLSAFVGLEGDDLEVLTVIWMGSVSAVVDWWLRHPDRSAAEMAARCARIVGALVPAER